MTKYTCCDKIFIDRGRKLAIMIVVGYVYSKMTKTLKKVQSKENLIKSLLLRGSTPDFWLRKQKFDQQCNLQFY